MITKLRSVALAFLFVLTVLGLAGVLDSARLYFGGVARAEVIAQIDAGIASGVLVESPVAVVPVAVPLPDPIANPIAALSELEQLEHQSWPLCILAALLMLAKVVQTWAPGHQQDTGTLGAAARWLAGGARATVIAGLSTVGAAALHALLLGGTWTAVALAAFGAALALFVPAPRPAQR